MPQQSCRYFAHKKKTLILLLQPKSSVRSRKKNYFIYFSDFYLLLALLKKKKRANAKVEALLSFFFLSSRSGQTHKQKILCLQLLLTFFRKKNPKTATRLNDVKKKKPYRQFFPQKFRKASKVSLTFF